MAPLGWLEVADIDFNTMLLLESLHVRYIAERTPGEAMGTALAAHPAVQWYLEKLYAPVSNYNQACLTMALENPTPEQIREAEIAVLNTMQDWLIYVLDPAKYDQLEFLKWDDASLLSMADFKDKIVLDIGSGTGRLAFAIAAIAQVVYAVEPVANLRRFLWQKQNRLGCDNVFPADGTLTQIPFLDNFADILMAGHVFGDDIEAEYAEMCRVVHTGGILLLHPGTNARNDEDAHHFLLSKGFEFDSFEEPGDGFKRKYWLTINK